jgi:broad specificity phosphatase PhoE
MSNTSSIKRIYLIRNAEAESNITRKFCRESGLTRNGENQADVTGEFLAKHNIHSIYTSPLLHAKKTAERIAKITNLKIKEEKGLANIDTGAWEGLTKDEIYDTWPDEWQKIINGDFKAGENIVPGGEIIDVFFERVINSFNNVLSETKSSQNILVVAHNFSIAAILCSIVDASYKALVRFEQFNCALSCLDSNQNYTKIIYSNSISHLEDAKIVVNEGAISGKPLSY